MGQTMEGVLFESAIRTVAASSERKSSRGAEGLIISVTVSLDAEAASITPSVQALTPDEVWHTIWTAAAPIAAVGTTLYQLGRGLLASAGGGYTDTENILIPPTWRMSMAVADTDDITWLANYMLVGI